MHHRRNYEWKESDCDTSKSGMVKKVETPGDLDHCDLANRFNGSVLAGRWNTLTIQKHRILIVVPCLTRPLQTLDWDAVQL